MLVHLSVHDVVLIDQLELEFDDGLCALTGETGAGKSILLDALGLVLGRRAEVSLVRKGAQRAAVAATFRFSLGHPAVAFVEQMGIECEGEIVIRRTINLEGRSRGFVNDQPVTVACLAELGCCPNPGGEGGEPREGAQRGGEGGLLQGHACGGEPRGGFCVADDLVAEAR